MYWSIEIYMYNCEVWTYRQADSYVERLEQEIMELQRRDAELRHILDTEDNIHFLQVHHPAPEPSTDISSNSEANELDFQL